MSRLRIGIIGCGGIANGKHLPSLKAINRADIVAFCDLIPERAEKAAKEYGVPGAKVFTDYKELLKLDLDVVHVLTPNKQHSFITVDALEAGKHVVTANKQQRPSPASLVLMKCMGVYYRKVRSRKSKKCVRVLVKWLLLEMVLTMRQL